MVSGKYLSCIKRLIRGQSKILALNFSVRSAGNFSHKYAKQSLSPFRNCFINLSWIGRGEISTDSSLDKSKESV